MKWLLTLALISLTCGQPAFAAAPAPVTSLAKAKPAAPTPANTELAYVDALKKVITVGPYDGYAKQIQGLFAAGQFDAMDSYFNALQQAYEGGRITDKMLAYAYQPLDQLKGVNDESIFKAWLAKNPNSYPAQYLHVNYLINVAWDARGTEFSNKTSAAQFMSFAAILQKAMAENDALISKNATAKPILSFANKLLMLRAGSSLNLKRPDTLTLAQTTLAKANALDPNNIIARYNYMTLLSPRWGGSFEEMKAFAAQIRAEKVPASIADYFDGMIQEEYGDATARKSTYAKAAPYYYAAAKLQEPYYDYGDNSALKSYIYSTFKTSFETTGKDPNTKEFLGLLNTLLRDGRYIENPGWYYGERAQTRLNVAGDLPGAWDDFQRGAAAGDAHSLYNVARVYCYGQPGLPIKPDTKLCPAYMGRAAASGSKPAQADPHGKLAVPTTQSGSWLKP